MSVTDMRKDYAPKTIMIYDRKNDSLLKEPSLLAIDKPNAKVAAAGSAAEKLIGSEDDDIIIVCPLKNGMIADYTVAQKMFHMLLQKAMGSKPLIKPKIAVCLPIDATEVECKAFMDAFYQSGAKEVYLTQEPFEEALRTLPSSYRIIVGIVQGEAQTNEGGGAEKESWEEVCKGIIPAGQYRTISIVRGKQATTIGLESGEHRVKLVFSKAAAVRLFDRTVLPDGIYSSAEIARFRESSFRNVLYSIGEGEFSGSLKAARRGKALTMNIEDYVMITENDIIEVLAEGEPAITVD